MNTSAPEATALQALGEHIAGIGFEQLPPAVVDAARIGLLDTLGVTLAGAAEPSARLLRTTLGLGAEGGCTIIGTALRAGPLDAAMANGVAAHALDFDDCNNTVGGHPSVPMLPALLALAEVRRFSGAELLTAYVAGFETMAALGRVLNTYHYRVGWHPTATLGVFAGAAACARALRLEPEQATTALAIAASLASGVKANFGTMTKPLHVGHTARNGLLAALLAEQGFTAEPGALEHPQGFYEVFNGAGNYAPALLLEGWCAPYNLVDPGLAIKAYPCCASTHPAIDAMLALREGDGLRADQVRALRVRTHTRRLAHTDRPRPSSALEAKFSVQHCVARALLDGSVNMAHFEGQRFREREVTDLMARISTAAHDDDNHFGAYLEATLRDGSVLETYVPTPLGRDRSNPLPRERLLAKFHACASRGVSAQIGDTLAGQLSIVETLNDTAGLVALLRADPAVPEAPSA